MAEPNGNRDTRMDRIEKALELMISDHEQFRQEHKQLLISQVVQSGQIANNSRQIEALTQRMNQQVDITAALDSRVDKLVSSIGDLIARIPPASLSR